MATMQAIEKVHMQSNFYRFSLRMYLESRKGPTHLTARGNGPINVTKEAGMAATNAWLIAARGYLLCVGDASSLASHSAIFGT